MPAQQTMRPKLEIVEYASTFLPSDWEMATKDANRNVAPPMNMVIRPAWFGPSTGQSFMIRNTPAFTIVEECSKAEVGVGATMAPSSQPENGIMAALVKPQKTSSATAISTGCELRPRLISMESSTDSYSAPSQRMAAANATPPSRFIQRALNEFSTASSVCV